MILLDGKKTSEIILGRLKETVSEMSEKPLLEVVIVGNDPASVKYVEMKRKAGERIGVDVKVNHLPEGSRTEEVVGMIREFSEQANVAGIMVQLPLPEGVDKVQVLEAISPQKDVDGLTRTNQELLSKGDPSAIAPATPLGIMELLKEYKVDVTGKNVVIINNSTVVGLPLGDMMTASGAQVTICHGKTENIPEKTVQADILVSGVGKAGMITADMVKDGAVVIDVGIDIRDGKVMGDVDFENVKEKCSYITPVPGGVGPMTVASLLLNLVNVSKI
jgi:methylenetetrahydrofolate dehydrogenase (NADP+)/methenyltetrahydrofolate cyclohydrolase